MPRTALLVFLVCSLFAGCAGHRSGKTCCLIAGGVGLVALFGLAESAVDGVIDPEPTNTDTAEGKRKHWEWEQRQLENSLPSLGDQ
jgi:hypothetical protein